MSNDTPPPVPSKDPHSPLGSTFEDSILDRPAYNNNHANPDPLTGMYDDCLSDKIIVLDNARMIPTPEPLPPVPPPKPGQQRHRPSPRAEKRKSMLARPWVVWFLTAVQIIVFLAEFIRMGVLTGTPVQKEPSFNPMIGPSTYVLINMGARFTPCMHAIANVTDDSTLLFPCANSTKADTNVCSLSELCGMGGLPNPKGPGVPNQWWRFITPTFLHAGLVHIGFNMLLQLTLGSAMERDIGHIRFTIVYFMSGIAGFVLGGNFTPDGVASTGASGALFGIIALDFLDLLLNWHQYESPKKALLVHLAEIIVSFGIGLLPGLDNFSHIGGFAMGLLLGVAILQSPLPILQRKAHKSKARGASKPKPFEKDLESQTRVTSVKVFTFDWLKDPRKKFRNQPRLWYLWFGVRLVAIGLAIVYMVVLIHQFESNGGSKCTWCKYLSCIPVNGWCDIGNIEITTTSSRQSGYMFLSIWYLWGRQRREVKRETL